jgi:hypothetical protein
MRDTTPVTDFADELLDQIADDLAADVDALALEVIRRLVIRRARQLVLAGDPMGAVDGHEPDHDVAGDASSTADAERTCTRCRNRPADDGFKSCTRCRDWAREERRRLRARTSAPPAASANGRGDGASLASDVDARPLLSELEVAASGRRGVRAAEIAAGARDVNALRV